MSARLQLDAARAMTSKLGQLDRRAISSVASPSANSRLSSSASSILNGNTATAGRSRAPLAVMSSSTNLS